MPIALRLVREMESDGMLGISGPLSEYGPQSALSLAFQHLRRTLGRATAADAERRRRAEKRGGRA